jgi:hypothetical protein
MIALDASTARLTGSTHVSRGNDGSVRAAGARQCARGCSHQAQASMPFNLPEIGRWLSTAAAACSRLFGYLPQSW